MELTTKSPTGLIPRIKPTLPNPPTVQELRRMQLRGTAKTIAFLVVEAGAFSILSNFFSNSQTSSSILGVLALVVVVIGGLMVMSGVLVRWNNCREQLTFESLEYIHSAQQQNHDPDFQRYLSEVVAMDRDFVRHDLRTIQKYRRILDIWHSQEEYKLKQSELKQSIVETNKKFVR